jgi:hypothetical protein
MIPFENEWKDETLVINGIVIIPICSFCNRLLPCTVERQLITIDVNIKKVA